MCWRMNWKSGIHSPIWDKDLPFSWKNTRSTGLEEQAPGHFQSIMMKRMNEVLWSLYQHTTSTCCHPIPCSQAQCSVTHQWSCVWLLLTLVPESERLLLWILTLAYLLPIYTSFTKGHLVSHLLLFDIEIYLIV